MAKTAKPATPATTAAEPKPPVVTGELVPSGPQEIGEAIPDFIPVGEATGSENITRDDIQMPRLALAQAMSPQKDETKEAFIEGLKIGDMFNTLTRRIYGKGPFEIVVVRTDRPRWAEFDKDRNLIDPNVAPNDPRTLWRTIDGERVPPIATQFYDYVVVLLDTMEPIAVSMSKTNIRAAKKLNGLIATRMPPVPIYARRFLIESAMETNDQGTYAIFSVKAAGNSAVPNSDLVKTRDVFEACKALYEQMKTKEIVFESPREEVGDTSFDTAAMEREAAQAKTSTM